MARKDNWNRFALFRLFRPFCLFLVPICPGQSDRVNARLAMGPIYFYDICDKYVILIEKDGMMGYYNTILQSGMPVKTIRSPP